MLHRHQRKNGNGEKTPKNVKNIDITLVIDIKLHKSYFLIFNKIGPFINAMGKMLKLIL